MSLKREFTTFMDPLLSATTFFERLVLKIEIYINKYSMKKLQLCTKQSMKKLQLCTKTAFTLKNIIYEQKDGASMGSSVGPLQANVIMTQLENVVIKPLIANGLVDFYCYVNITFLVVKQEDANHILSLLNTFYCNLRFIVGVFDKKVPSFLDLEVSSDGISIFLIEYQYFGRILKLVYM